MKRPYYYSKSGESIAPPNTAAQRRTISSVVNGQVYNTMGDEWQELADTLHQLAVVHGTVIEIELDDPRINDLWLDFTISFDNTTSSGKFITYLETLNKIQPVSYIRMVEYGEPPPPPTQTQPII